MKTKIFKLLSGLICVSLMLTLISPAAFAENDDGLYVELIAPTDGETADFEPYITWERRERYDVSMYNGEGFIDGVRVCDLNAGRNLTETDVITYEHDYKVDIIIEAKAGYGFQDYQGTPNVKAYIMSYELNGYIKHQAEVQWFSNGKDKIVMTYVYDVKKTESINFVSLNVTAPEQGKYPSYDYEILSDYIEMNDNHDDGEYCINGITWHHGDADYWDTLWLGEPVSKDEVFVGGNTYRLTIRIAAEHDLAQDIERKFGFSFAPYTMNSRVRVNGFDTRGRTDKPTPDDKSYADSYYIIYKDFYCPPKTTIEKVALEVDPPMLGHNPDFDVAFCSEGYRIVQDYTDDGFINGIKWRDMTNGENLTEDDMFEENCRYVFSVYLEPADENTAFAVDSAGETVVTGTMNGDTATIGTGYMIYYEDPKGNDSQAIEYEYSFGMVSNEITRVAVLNIAEPTAGETPDYTATVKNDKLYTFDTANDNEVIVNGISWRNNTTMEEMNPTDVFEVGTEYSVFVYLTVGEKYTIGNTVAGSVNGMESLVYAIGGNNKLVLIYTFSEVEPLKTSHNKAMGLTFPAEGELPYYDITLENSNSVIKEIRWCDVSAGEYIEYITAEDAFVGGHKYQLELDLVPDENYEFMTDDEGNIAFELLFEIGGVEYEGIVEGTKDEITAIYRFNRLPISIVDISIDAPSPDFAPSFIAYADSDAYYAVNVTWYDKTADVYITEEDDYVFEENHVYVVTADVFAGSDGCFDAYSDKFIGTVNKKAADIGSVFYREEGYETIILYSSYYALRFSYEFKPCMYENVLTAEYDKYTGSLSVSHEIYSPFEDDTLAVYIAFYDSDDVLISCIVKDVKWANDIYGETVPDDAVYCKAMLWNKITYSPLCNFDDCEIVKEV